MIDIFIRQTIDWESMNQEKFLSQSFNHTEKYWKNLINKINNYIKIWKKFSISYFMYRKHIKDIAKKNLLSTKCNIISDTTYFNKNHYNSLFIAIDDDDWLCPNIYNELEIFVDQKNIDIIIWNHTILEHNGKISLQDNRNCFTNNFALTKTGISKLQNIETDYEDGYLVAKNPFLPHYDIHRRIIKNDIETRKKIFSNLKKDNFNIVYLDKRLNISNKSLASASLIDKMSKKEYFCNLKNLSKLKISNFFWAEEEIKSLNKLNNMVNLELKYF